jgi:hypothetical protein
LRDVARPHGAVGILVVYILKAASINDSERPARPPILPALV